MEPKSYETIAARAFAEFTERHSHFLGALSPCQTEREALSFLSEVRAVHHKATHNVYAYILRDGNTTRYSDDGEPQGTAALPVLDVLQKQGLTDVCCVVTRYFGGILLGGGGLVRAYSHTASLAVEAADTLHMAPCLTVRLVCAYSLYGRLAALLPACGAQVLESEFFTDVTLLLRLTEERYPAFADSLTDAANGQISLSIMDKGYANIP